MEEFVRNKQDVNNLPTGPNGKLNLDALDKVGAYPNVPLPTEKDIDEMTIEELEQVRAGLTNDALNDMHR
ncbi:MAG TPA: hypothetical protein PLT65_05230 [Bacilli bacterium]|jgi:hypothetical protein|nr:hypothetical protein [Bacilli bacterium]